MVDINFALDIFSSELETAIHCFERFMNEKAEDIGIMVYRPSKLTDQEAKPVIQRIAGSFPAELQTMEKKKRNEILRQMKQFDGITTRQLARLTGITQIVTVRV